ncbi:amidohydrolase family protein [Anaerolineales bacterium HSG6]|nr:amidohydrolase family protein [Anaerolineales bacterium HSG6]
MKIDAHVHYMPPSLKENLADFAAREPYWGLLVTPPSIQGWATPERMIADMDAAGLDKVVLVGEYFYQHSACVARNNQAIDLINRWPERIMALATIQPTAGDTALTELKRCISAGLVGVGELNPYTQGYHLDDPNFLRLVEACIMADLPLNLHVNEAVGPYYPGKSTTPLRHYYQLARRYPQLKLILAHWGGGLFFYELMPRVQQDLHNVWYDTAASPLLFPTEKIFRIAILAIKPHKILFGSDYPLRIYPQQQKEPEFQTFMTDIAAVGLEEMVYQDIMGGNTARLFGLMGDERAGVLPTSIRSEGVSTAGEASLASFSDLVQHAQSVDFEENLPDMSVGLVAVTWPQTQAVFDQFGIPWQDNPVPIWEPVGQAAAARGMNPTRQKQLLQALNEACCASGEA